jgi:poly(3-hydroxybutyrate) depolymerase
MNCSGQNEVLLYQINNGGHTWPGANTGIFSSLVLGPTNQDKNAGVCAWNFLEIKICQPVVTIFTYVINAL